MLIKFERPSGAIHPIQLTVSVLGAVDTTWGPIKIGLYARYLERWLQYFSLSQFLFVSGERLIVDPAFEIGRVQDFLGLKRIVTEKYFYFNSSKGFPCLIKSEASSSPHCLGKVIFHIPYTSNSRIIKFHNQIPYIFKFHISHCLDPKSKGRNHPYISPSAHEQLKQFYRPYNMKFYRMTGIDFGWP